jgi:hypothetical protein
LATNVDCIQCNLLHSPSRQMPLWACHSAPQGRRDLEYRTRPDAGNRLAGGKAFHSRLPGSVSQPGNRGYGERSRTALFSLVVRFLNDYICPEVINARPLVAVCCSIHSGSTCVAYRPRLCPGLPLSVKAVLCFCLCLRLYSFVFAVRHVQGRRLAVHRFVAHMLTRCLCVSNVFLLLFEHVLGCQLTASPFALRVR